jgi:hypothetical protein
MVYLAKSERRLWGGRRISDNRDSLTVSVAYRPIADVQQTKKTPHEAGLYESLSV